MNSIIPMANRGQWILGAVFSITLHIVLIVAVLFGARWANAEAPKTKKIQVVNAVFMDDVRREIENEKKRQEQLQREKDRKLKEKQRKEQAEKRRQQKLEEQRIAKEKARLKKIEDDKKKAELKRQKELAEKARLKKLKEDQERQKKIEQAKIEEKKRLDELKKKKLEQERQAKIRKQKELEKKQKLAREQKAREDALAAMMAAEEQDRLDSELERKRDEYRYLIQQKVQSNWVQPAGTSPDFECLVHVKQIPGGDVVSVKVEGCGSILLDQSVIKAIEDSSPLPDGDPRVVERELEFVFRPES